MSSHAYAMFASKEKRPSGVIEKEHIAEEVLPSLC